jgi:hypothetical protein
MRIEDRVDAMLDQALEMTFPASDPISVYIPEASAVEAKVSELDTLADAAGTKPCVQPGEAAGREA